jgi:chromosomal replication initiator protein
MNKEIDFSLVKDVIKERVGSSFSSNLSIEDIVRKVSEVSRIPEKEIIGKSRKMEFVEARQISMYLCRDIMETSLNNIGVYFGGRDHTTVMHAVKTINDKKLKDVRIKKMVESLKQELDFTFV